MAKVQKIKPAGLRVSMATDYVYVALCGVPYRVFLSIHSLPLFSLERFLLLVIKTRDLGGAILLGERGERN